MYAEIIGAGSQTQRLLEWLSPHLPRELAALGVRLGAITDAQDDPKALRSALAAALGRSDIVITIGGLGPGGRLNVKEIIAGGLGLELVPHEATLRRLRAWCDFMEVPFTTQTASLAYMPQGAELFEAEAPGSPGFALRETSQCILMLPDGEEELAAMLTGQVMDYLADFAGCRSESRTARVYGLPFEEVCDRLGDLVHCKNPVAAVYRSGRELLVRCTGLGEDRRQAASGCRMMLDEVCDRLAGEVYGLGSDTMEKALVELLRRRGIRLSVAESGTAGMLSRRLNGQPGAREVFLLGVLADTPEKKSGALGVPEKLMKKFGELSPQTAAAMALGALEEGGASLGLAVCGGENFGAAPVYLALTDGESAWVQALTPGSQGAPDAEEAALSAMNLARRYLALLPQELPGAIPLERAMQGKKRGERKKPGKKSPAKARSAAGEEAPAKKRPWYGAFLPCKGDGGGEIARKMILIVLILVFLCSAGYLVYYKWDSYHNAQLSHGVESLYHLGEEGEVDTSNLPDGWLAKFAALYEINPDIRGWLSIDGTQLSYPVVQTTDNDFYHRRNFYKESNNHGVPYIDYLCDVQKPSDNIIIYGHNMRDGQMFGELINYENLAYYKEHPVISFDSVYEENDYKIVSVFITNVYERDGPVFHYIDFIDAASEAEYNEFINQVKIRSLINTGVDAVYGDKLLTLSTCTYEFSDARLVVVARQVRDGESAEMDTSSATYNANPLMPEVWYETYAQKNSDALAEGTTVSVDSSASTVPAEPDPLNPSQSQPEQSSSSTGSEEASGASESSSEAQSSSSASSSEGEVSWNDPSSSLGEELPPPPTEAGAGSSSQESSSEEESSQEEDSSSEEEEEEDNDEVVWTADADVQGDREVASANRYPAEDTFYVTVGGRRQEMDAFDAVCSIVQNETNGLFYTEALKAQAVAAYSYLKYESDLGLATAVPDVTPSSTVERAVEEVFGEMVQYQGKVAYTPYHGTSNGMTQSSADVWGGSYPYLEAVDSYWDEDVKNFETTYTISADSFASKVERVTGIELSGDPEDWLEITGRNDSGYVTSIRLDGESRSQGGSLGSGVKLTGRVLRESILGGTNLRSTSFDFKVKNDKFVFTVQGYGHGVGMSQTGANEMAREGYTYDEILTHYYPGTEVA